MKGFIDRLSRPKDKVIWIHDYKAKGYFPTQQELDDDRQLAYYQLAIKSLWPDTEEIELVWHYLIFDQEIHSRRTTEELETLRVETIALIDEIESTRDFPAKQSGLCNWCEHQPRCPHFKHLHQTATLSKNDYMGNEGVQLAERLVTLQDRETALKAELMQVKEALADYAKKNEVEVVFTKGHKVRVKVYDNIRFPGRKDPGRSELENTIREGGRWEEASSLDVFALSKLLQKAHWDSDLIEKIMKYGTEDTTLWIKAFPRNERGRWSK